MKRSIFKWLGYALLICLLLLCVAVFYPGNYNVPQLQTRAGTQYWKLKTGSAIGYTIIAAKGEKKSYPIIYLHGGPGGYVSDKIIQTLSPLADEGYNVYLYDQVGSGQSARLDDITQFTVGRHIADLKEIIQNTGTQKVILIGQSWGAILAALFAADNSDNIEKIIFTSPGPVYPVNNELLKVKAPENLHLKNPVFTNAQGNKVANNIRTMAMAYCATTFGFKLSTDKEADNFDTYLNYELNKSTVCDTTKIPKQEAGGGYYAGIMTYKSLTTQKDPRPKIKALNVPVLIMKGQCDNQPWGFTYEYTQLFKNHQLIVIPNAGHYIALEQPALYIQTIKDFLNK